MNKYDRVLLFGFSFINASSTRDIAKMMVQDIQGKEPAVRYLITPNASTVVYYDEAKNKTLKDFYGQADYVLADGMPVVWLSKLKRGKELSYRLTGSDLFPELWGKIKQERLPVAMVLPNDKLEHFYHADYPNSSTIVPRMFEADDDNYIRTLGKEVAIMVQETQSHFVFLGLNFPKQEKLGMAIGKELEALRVDWPVTILLLGASFEFYAGMKERAPEWMQRAGLEWFYRFRKEPRRLAKRYTVDNFRFLLKAIKELVM